MDALPGAAALGGGHTGHGEDAATLDQAQDYAEAVEPNRFVKLE